MVIRLKDFAIKPSAPLTPLWVKSRTTSTLYKAVIAEYVALEKSIRSSKSTPIRARQIILRQIAAQCNVSPSTVTTRRQPELIELIKTLNTDLTMVYNEIQASHYESGKKSTKEQITLQNKQLTTEIERLRNLNLSNALTVALDYALTEECRNQAITINKLRKEIKRLELVISEQAQLNQKYMDSME